MASEIASEMASEMDTKWIRKRLSMWCHVFRGSRKILHFQTVSDRAEFVLALYMVPMLVLHPSVAAVGSFFDH